MAKYRGVNRFSVEFRRGRWTIIRKRPWDEEWELVPEDEARWATNVRRQKALFLWHRNYGLARRDPHPMGKDLDVLDAAWRAENAASYIKAGMTVPGIYLPRPAP